MTPQKLWLDSETYSEYPINNLIQYTNNCIPIIITYAFDDEPVQVWEEGQPLPQDLIEVIEAGTPMYSHNVLFDFLALRRFLPLKLEQMHDTMAVASSNNLPASLDKFCEALGTAQQKEKSGKALIRKFCIPNKKGDRIMPTDAPEQWAEFIHYAVMDVESMREATKRCRPLSDYEQEVWQFTQRMNLIGAPVDVEAATHFKELAHKVKDALNQELYELTGIDSASKVAQLKDWLNNNGCELEGLAKDNISEALRNDPEPKIKRVLEIRQQASMTSPKKFDVFIQNAFDGRLYAMFMYHGASTGRYASRGGVNLQNVPRGSQKDPIGAFHHIEGLSFEDYQFFYGNTIDPLSSLIRPTIRAPKGKKFVDLDYKSIENRVAPWIGGEMKHLELFRNNLDEYVDLAVDIYHVKYEDVTKQQRSISKSACLGNMYGAGAKGLQGYFEGYGMQLELEEAQRLVNLYRGKHQGIKKAWYAFGRTAIQAIQNKGTVFTTNRCKLVCKEGFLRLMLPSGRVISWFAPTVEERKAPWGDMVDAVIYLGKPKQGTKWVRQQLIGSSIFQSVVQATARDLLVDAMLRLEKRGWQPVMTIHDQVLAEVDEDFTEAEFEEFKTIMTTPPDWGKEIPLAVEGSMIGHYIKD